MFSSSALHRALFALFLSGTTAAGALAQTPPTPPGPQASAPAQTPAPQPSAVTVRLQYTGEAAANPIGGLRDGGSYTNNIDAQMRVDANRAFGWEGGKFLVEGFYTNGTSVNRDYVGAIQDPSPIDTEQGALWRLYQAYYEQNLGHTDILFGLYDIETEFGVTRPMDMFMNGAYAWNAALDVSGRNGPSTYPNTALGLRIRQHIGKEWTIRVAVLDGVPDSVKHPNSNAITINNTNGAFFIGEVDYQPTRTTKLLLGGWNYTGKFDSFTQSTSDGTPRQLYGSRGMYVGGATRLFDQGHGRGIDGFANLGFAGSRTNEVAASLNFGFTYTGPLAARPHDKLGLAFGVVKASGALKQGDLAAGITPTSYEKNLELSVPRSHQRLAHRAARRPGTGRIPASMPDARTTCC